jgi:ABC-type sugar transport system ATPase subunit
VTTAPQTGEAYASLVDGWKFYGDFAALKGVSLTLYRGEVHMLMGENGAGKSTLVSLLTGTNLPDRGYLEIRGRAVQDYTPLKARAEGMNVVLQDFSLAPALTVAENYFLGREIVRGGLIDRAEMRRRTADAVARLGVPLDPDAKVATLSRAEQQALEIVRAIGGTPGALILDEPTATLSHKETDRLFAIVEQLRAEGWAILYITHRMEEVRRLGNRITVLRDGQFVGSYALKDVSNERIVQDMVGRPITTVYPRIEPHPGDVALAVEGLTSLDGRVRDVSLSVRYGEIVGIGGLVGCGKAELARLIFGLSGLAAGTVRRDGKAVAHVRPRAMLDGGLVYLPQDRRGEALALNRTIGENVTAEVLDQPGFTRFGMLAFRALEDLVARLMTDLDIRPKNPGKLVQELSGGNQQKVVLGRALSRKRMVYVFDEPTAGIDVGARLEFYQQLKKLCDAGAAILLISSDLPELVHLSHRVYVMHDGAIQAEVTGDIREDVVVAHSFGEAPSLSRSTAS